MRRSLRRAWPTLALAFAVACSAGGNGTPNADTCAHEPWHATFDGAQTQLGVAIADDDSERAHGLMGVTDLPENHGMAFVWDAPTQSTFWMKDTLIPLSVAFVDANGVIVTIRDMAPCTSDPCAEYGATAPYVTAIEANQGWFRDHGIAEGDEVSVAQDPCS